MVSRLLEDKKPSEGKILDLDLNSMRSKSDHAKMDFQTLLASQFLQI